MSYYGARVFYGFVISEQYIKDLMSDWDKQDEYGHQIRYFDYDVCERLEKKLGDLIEHKKVELWSSGDHDIKRYIISVDDIGIDYSEIKEIHCNDCSNIQFKSLLEAKKRLSLESKDDDIGWHLCASED